MGEVISFDLIARDLASKAFKDAGGAADGFRGKLALVGGVVGGAVGAGLAKMGEHLEETKVTLKTAVADTGASFGEFAGQIDKAVGHEEKFGHGAADTNEALSILTRASGDTGAALGDLNVVTEIAAAKHESLADAASTVAKMHAGSLRPLKEFGITSDQLKTKAEELAKAHGTTAAAEQYAAAQTLILQRVHGTAEAQADTFGGKIKALKTQFGDMAAEIGTHVGPALTVAGPLIGGIGAIIDAEVVPAILSATAAALPWIAGIAAVAAAAYLLYRNWDTIWGFIKKITSDVVGFVNDHLTLILTIALGPLGFAIGELKDHWSTVWSTVQTAVEDMWKVIEPIFRFLKRAIDDIAGPLEKVAGGASKLISGAGSVLSHIPGFASGVTNFAGGMAVVGENGPELAYLPSGTSIMPHPAFADALTGQGTAFHSVFHITAPDPHRAAVSVNQGLRDAAFLMGV